MNSFHESSNYQIIIQTAFYSKAAQFNLLVDQLKQIHMVWYTDLNTDIRN